MGVACNPKISRVLTLCLATEENAGLSSTQADTELISTEDNVELSSVDGDFELSWAWMPNISPVMDGTVWAIGLFAVI